MLNPLFLIIMVDCCSITALNIVKLMEEKSWNKYNICYSSVDALQHNVLQSLWLYQECFILEDKRDKCTKNDDVVMTQCNRTF